MSKRKVTDPVTKFTSDLVRTPTSESGLGRVPNSQTYFKRNYVDAVKIITPDIYFADDIALSGTEVPAVSQLINSHILAADATGVMYVSALDTVDYLSSIDQISGLSKYFVKQNNLTWIASKDFEEDILVKLGKTYSSFDSSAAFINYLSGTFLPTIVLQQGNSLASNDLADNTASAFDNTSSGTHKYLIDKLSWLYFLNTSDAAGASVRPATYTTSAEVATLMAHKLWSGDVIALNDALQVFEKYLWSNYSSFSSIDERILPNKYRASGTGLWTSSTQQRDRLDTLVDVVYSPHYFNDIDKKVESAFNDYIDVTSLLTDTESAGPFSRLLEAFSFSFADRSGEAKELETLVDIDSCPDEYLPYLADLIGWTLIGPDASRHRNQLRQAVAIYKAKGTKRSVQGMVDTVFGSPSAFNVTSGTLFDLWESYIPNLLFYTLTTSSTLTNNGLETFTKQTAQNLGIDRYSATDLDKNVRLAVDRIMWELINEFPNNFIFANKIFPRVKFFYANAPELEYKGDWVRDESGKYYTGTVAKSTSFEIVPTQDPDFIFKYRDRVMPIPPWEDIKYYSNCEISLGLLNAIKKKLLCFGVDEYSAQRVFSYIKDNTVANEDSNFYRNSFLFFTTLEKSPFNYEDIVNVKRPQGNELIKYLPYWSSKSSHFKIVLTASSFDFASNSRDKDSKYALAKVKTLVNTVAPAHSIPDIILDVSSVEDFNLSLSAVSTQTAQMGLSSVAASGSSGTILTNFAVSAVNPRNTSVLPAAMQTVFRREDADSLSDPLFGSGTADIYFSSAPRNAVRRKNYKYLMDGENIDLRDGDGAAGYQWLYRATQLPSFYSTGANLLTSGIFSLGFIPSSLSFVPVALVRDPNNFGNLIDRVNIDPVWHKCQAYNSSDSFYQIEVSNTFPFRGLSGVDSSSTSSFFDGRGALSELQALQCRVKETSVFQEASSIVSGYFNVDGTVNTVWPSSSVKIQPTTLSSWYVDASKDVVNSIANQLHENTSSVDNVDYMRDFKFGSTFHRFYRQWLENYTRVAINFNKKYTGADDIISHTYGPYVFNSDFEITASSVDVVAPTLVASTVGSIIDIGFNMGAGVLSLTNDFGITNEVASDASSMYVWWPEIRNDTLLSGVEFVDTSNPYTAPNGIAPLIGTPPTFGLLKLSNLEKDLKNNNKLPLWAQPSVLQDNLIIRYGRSNHNSFPRLRYKIEPDSARPDIKNFLVPDCEYELAIKACNINPLSQAVGGQTIKAWIHTEPISYTYKLPNGSYTTETSVWSFFNGQWIRTKLSDINEDTSFMGVISRSPGKQFELRSIASINIEGAAESGTQRSVISNEVITPYEDLNPRIGCVEESSEESEEENQPVLWGSAQIYETLSINFNTHNSDVSQQVIQKIHTKDRKYYIEIFLEEVDSKSFVLFDTISMYNKTFKEKASVPTEYNKYELNKKELKACFDYFTSLAKSRLASRDAFVTSGNMEVSGGGRLSYRDNVYRDIYALSGDGGFGQVSSLIIRGN